MYQVKHSYDKKSEYFNDTEDQLAHDDRSMFQGRKERVGSYGDGNVEKTVEDTDVRSKPEEVKSGETVFDKDNSDSHEDDARNLDRPEAEERQTSGADGNAEAHSGDEDTTTGHSAASKHDDESNSSDSESEVYSTGDDVPQNNNAQEEIAAEANGTSHEEVAQSDGSTNGDQINASSNGSDGQQAEKKEATEFQADSESLSDGAKAGASDEHASETLPDETGNIPSVHNENPQNGASENQGDAASVTSDPYEHSNGDTVHIEIGSEHEGATTSSGTASGDAEKGNSVESNPSDSISVEEKAGVASGGDEKGLHMGTSNEASSTKEANSEEGVAVVTEVSIDPAANMQTENSQGASAAEVANGSSEEMKPVENQTNGATKSFTNGEQNDIKIEINISTNDDHQGGDGSSGSNSLNGSGPEQTGKSETQ